MNGSIRIVGARRALATRYDKHALTYRGGIILAAILIWTNDFRDTP